MDTTPNVFNISSHHIASDYGPSGYSLRSLVNRGLYAQYRNAVRALKKSGYDYAETRLSGEIDHLISCKRDALKFIASARTKLGKIVKGQVQDGLIDISPSTMSTIRLESLDAELDPAMLEPQHKGYKTLDWSMLVREYPEGRGISLRALVDEGGVYAQYRDARAAYERGAYSEGIAVSAKSGSKPFEDVLFGGLHQAQLFCVRARTEGGAAIAEIILEHHNEFQKLLEGSHDEAREVVERVVEHRVARETQDQLTSLQEALIDAQKQNRQMYEDYRALASGTIDELKSRNEKLDDMVKRYQQIRPNMRRPDEMTPTDIANLMGWLSASGKGHGQAINAAFDLVGAKEGEHYRLIWDNNQASENGNGMYRYRVYPKDVARELCKQVYAMVNPAFSMAFSFKAPNNRNCHVKLGEHHWLPKEARQNKRD